MDSQLFVWSFTKVTAFVSSLTARLANSLEKCERTAIYLLFYYPAGLDILVSRLYIYICK